MGEDNIKLTGGTLFNLNTGDKIEGLSFDLSDCSLSESTEECSLNFSPRGTMSFGGEINKELLKLFVESISKSYDAQIQVPVQRRRHRKKRIDKKWAKRYGYITKQMGVLNLLRTVFLKKKSTN